MAHTYASALLIEYYMCAPFPIPLSAVDPFYFPIYSLVVCFFTYNISLFPCFRISLVGRADFSFFFLLFSSIFVHEFYYHRMNGRLANNRPTEIKKPICSFFFLWRHTRQIGNETCKKIRFLFAETECCV